MANSGTIVSTNSPVTAALGGEVSVPTPEGEARLKIPAGTANGKVFRLRGKGVPHLPGYGRGRGDQYVRVSVEVPKGLSKSQKEALRKFDESFTDEK